jgi:molecular chaperone HtpG
LGFEGKPFKSITQGAADLDQIPLIDEPAAGETDDAATGTLIALVKQTLGDQVKDVRKSARLTTSAVCLVTDAGFDRTLERLLSRQKTTGVAMSAPILEINPRHPAIIALAKAAKAKGASPELEDAARLLLDQAYVLEGEPVGDPASFGKRMTEMMQKAFAG